MSDCRDECSFGGPQPVVDVGKPRRTRKWEVSVTNNEENVSELGEELLEKISQELTCSICRGFMTNPSTIVCGHSFCAECIGRVKPNKRMNKRCCPLCRTPFREHGEVNIALKSVLKLLKNHGIRTHTSEEEIQQLLEQQIRDSYTCGLARWYVPGVPVTGNTVEPRGNRVQAHTEQSGSSSQGATTTPSLETFETSRNSQELNHSSQPREESPRDVKPRGLHLERVRQFLSRLLDLSSTQNTKQQTPNANSTSINSASAAPTETPRILDDQVPSRSTFPLTQEQIFDSYTYGLASQLNQKSGK